MSMSVTMHQRNGKELQVEVYTATRENNNGQREYEYKYTVLSFYFDEQANGKKEVTIFFNGEARENITAIKDALDEYVKEEALCY